MLSEKRVLEGSPRARRPSLPRGTTGGILFGMAVPNVPELTLHWPSWLTPVNGGWKPAAHRPSGRRSD